MARAEDNAPVPPELEGFVDALARCLVAENRRQLAEAEKKIEHAPQSQEQTT